MNQWKAPQSCLPGLSFKCQQEDLPLYSLTTHCFLPSPLRNATSTKVYTCSLLQHHQNYLCLHSGNNYMYLAMTVHISCLNKKKLWILVLYLVRLILEQREVYVTKPQAPEGLGVRYSHSACRETV